MAKLTDTATPTQSRDLTFFQVKALFVEPRNFESMYVCVAHTYQYEYIHVGTCVWKKVVNAGCLSSITICDQFFKGL